MCMSKASPRCAKMDCSEPVRGEDHGTFSFHFFRDDFPQVTLGARVHARAWLILWREEQIREGDSRMCERNSRMCERNRGRLNSSGEIKRRQGVN